MEEEYMKISLNKVIELILQEERQKIRTFYLNKLGKQTADMMDSYTPSESETLKLFSK